MPLSDRERQVLEEIERGLHESDPRLVAKLREDRPAPKRANWLVVAALAITGLAVLVLSVAVATQVGAVGAAVLGGAGFGIMVAALYLAGRSYGAPRASAGPTPRAQQPRSSGKLSVMQRLEARWERRFEERDR